MRSLASILVILVLSLDVAANDYTLDGSVNFYPQRDGSSQYVLAVKLAGDWFSEFTLRSPSGQVFDTTSGDIRATTTGYTLDEINQVFAGTWTLTEPAPAGGAEQVYEFTLFAITDDFFYRPGPSIIVPTDNAVVPRTFELHFENLNERNLGFGYSREGDGIALTVARTPVDSGTWLLEWSTRNGDFPPAVQIRDFRLLSGNGSYHAFSEVAAINASSPSTFDYELFDFRTFSEPVSFVIVPEPNAMWIVSVLAVGSCLILRR